MTFVVPGDVTAVEGQDDAMYEGFSGRQGHLLRLSGWIDVESRLTVSGVFTYTVETDSFRSAALER